MDSLEVPPELLTFPDRIGDFFIGKSIFLSGGTGFMGKVLVEKILRSLTGLNKLYLLVRPKKGKFANERLKEIFAGPLYDGLRKLKGEEIFKKVIPIAGDACEINLGISEKDRQILINEVEVVFHCAATIRFDEALRKAVLLNVRGTKYMLELAKEMKKLLVFTHVSTAYCHLSERILYEKAYPPPADPHKVIKACEWMSDDVIDSITDKILGDYPNSYAFTKALGEALVVEQMDNLPVIILRPSVVIPCWLGPIKGWTDNLNGPTGLLIGAGKGVIRTMYCQGNHYADYVPVDIAANVVVVATFDFIYHKGLRRIYNCTSSAEYKISWEEIINIGRKVIETRIPLNGVVWYPGGSMKRIRFIHNICFFLFQLVPAVILDGLLIVLGYKPVLMRVQQRIKKGYEVFEYYANKQWDFNNDDSMKARKLLNQRELHTWKVDGNGVNYEEYFTHCTHAARLYILKEMDDTIPAARRHMRVMWWVDKITKTLMVLGLLYYIYTKVFARFL